MATKYAVATGNWSNTATWSDTDGGGGGATVPADGDTIVISAGVTVTVDADYSSHTTGFAGITIRGAAVTPGMLQFKSDADNTYYIKIKQGTDIVGTNATVFGRLMMGGGTWGSPAAPGAGRKQVIEFLGTTTGKIAAQYLSGQFICNTPTNLYVTPYAEKRNITNHTGVATNDYINDTSTPVANSDTIKFVAGSGTLPSPLTESELYFVVSKATNTFKVAHWASGPAIDLTTDGSGTYSFIRALGNAATISNILEDVSGDANWGTAAPFNNVFLVDLGPQSSADTQTLTCSATGSYTITVSATTNSVQYAGARIYLASRNVMIITNSTSTSVAIIDFANFVGSGSNSWSIDCMFYSKAGLYSSILTGVTAAMASYVTLAGCAYSLYACMRNCVNLNTSTLQLGCTYPLFSCTNCTHSGICASGGYGHYLGVSLTLSGTYLGLTAVLSNASGFTFSGTAFGCSAAVQSGAAGPRTLFTGVAESCYLGCSSTAVQLQGTIKYCPTGIDQCGNCVGQGGVLENAIDLDEPEAKSVFVGTQFKGASQVSSYAASFIGQRSLDAVVQCFDMPTAAGVARPGYMGVWTVSGTTKSADYAVGTHGTPPVTPPTCVHVTICEDSNITHRVDIPLWCCVDQAMTVNIYCKQPTASVMDDLAKWQLIDPGIIDGDGDEVLDEVTMTDNTSWQTLTLAAPTRTEEGPLILRLKVRGGTAGGGGTDTLWWFQVVEFLTPAVIAAAMWDDTYSPDRTLTA